MDCIFCKIVKGEIPSAKVYEDEKFFSFMDIFPIVRGHTLVIPKKHCRNIFDTDNDTASGIYVAVSKVAKAIKKGFNADGINIIQSNESEAGQEVFHSHIHIIPRYAGDNLNIFSLPRLKVEQKELNDSVIKIARYF